MKTHAFIMVIRVSFIFFNRIFKNIGANIAEHIFLTPRSSNYTTHENMFLATGKKISIPYNKYNLNGWIWGNSTSPIVLLVHGWNSNPASSFIDFVPALQKQGYCVVSYCAPGHESTPQQDAVTVPHLADSIIAVTKNIGSIYGVIGHSLGAASIVLATKVGFQPKKIIFISPLTDIVWAAHVKFASTLGISPKIIDIMLENIMQKYSFVIDKYGSNLYQIFRSDYQTGTLIIHDKTDKDIAWEQGKETHKKWPWSEFVSTENLGHSKIMHDQTVISKALEFLGSTKLAEENVL